MMPGTAYLTKAYGRLRVYVIHFPAHCAAVTNMSPHHNLSPAVKIYANIGVTVWDLAKKNTEPFH